MDAIRWAVAGALLLGGLGLGGGCTQSACAPGAGGARRVPLLSRLQQQKTFQDQVAADPFPTAQQQGLQPETAANSPASGGAK